MFDAMIVSHYSNRASGCCLEQGDLCILKNKTSVKHIDTYSCNIVIKLAMIMSVDFTRLEEMKIRQNPASNGRWGGPTNAER